MPPSAAAAATPARCSAADVALARGASSGLRRDCIPEAALAAAYKALKASWRLRGSAFAAFWAAEPRAARETLFNCVFPRAPLTDDEDDWNKGFDGEDVTMNARLFPEFVVDKVAGEARYFPGLYRGLLRFAKYQHAMKAEVAWCKGHRVALGGEAVAREDRFKIYDLKKGVFIRVDVEKAGGEDVALGAYQRMGLRPELATMPVYRAAARRLATRLMVLAQIFDEWETKMKIDRDEIVMDAFFHCGMEGCSRRETEDGRGLLSCTECALAQYCSREHQKADVGLRIDKFFPVACVISSWVCNVW